ncbi:hypothetical protein QQP08_010965, partial [Theobroma cacao]
YSIWESRSSPTKGIYVQALGEAHFRNGDSRLNPWHAISEATLSSFLFNKFCGESHLRAAIADPGVMSLSSWCGELYS